MRHTLFTLIIVLMIVPHGVAQENKSQDQKPITTESEKPKNAVDQVLEEAAKRGEVIIGTCLNEDCVKESTAGVEPGRLLQMPKPTYPAIARAARAEGEVEVKVIIGEEGTVIAAASISGHPLLQAASLAAARDAQFAPTLLYGKPVKVVGIIKYSFVVQ